MDTCIAYRQRVELLTAGHGHDEIDMADFEQEQSNETEVKDFFHGIDATCPTNVSQIGWVCWGKFTSRRHLQKSVKEVV